MSKQENRNNPRAVAELISELKQFPPDMCVVISGYEGGYFDAGVCGIISIKRNVNDAWYYGPHEMTDSGEEVIYIGNSSGKLTVHDIFALSGLDEAEDG